MPGLPDALQQFLINDELLELSQVTDGLGLNQQFVRVMGYFAGYGELRDRAARAQAARLCILQ